MKRKSALLLSLLLVVTAVVPVTSTVLAANSAPTVLPAIREWTGGSGEFTPNDSTVLVYDGTEANAQIELVKEFFDDMVGLDVSIATSGSSNAIIFEIDPNACNGEKEGYELVAAADSIKITAATKIGLLYGGISVVQSVYADGSFPVGTATDWPEYPTRSGMVDAARLYMPIEELTEVTKYMAWYKLNEIQVHLNDNGKNDYAAFRLECESYPELTADDGHYTKEEYRAYQKEVLEYGVRVISEIDTPYHSACFQRIADVKFLTTAEHGVADWYDMKCLDVSDARTVEIIHDIITEYIEGDDPVFIKDSEVICIGVDEYPASYSADVVEYAENLIKLVNSYGYSARFWGGMGENGCLQNADFESGLDYQTNYWVESYSGLDETRNMDCDVINFLAGWLYLVPGSQDDEGGYEDYFAESTIKSLYEGWWVERYSMYNTGSLLPADDPNELLGASFSVWNDYGSAWFGLTYHDVVDRFREAACFVAEKTWSGSDTGKTITYSNYKARYDALSSRGGNADPFNNKALEDGEINIDFINNMPLAVNNASAENIVADGFVLDGTASFVVSYEAVGFPNTLSFDITLDELPSERAPLFSGYDTEGIDIYIDTDGTIGIKAKINEAENEYDAAYNFTFDYKLTPGVKTNITLTCDRKVTTLIVDKKYAYEVINDHQSDVLSTWADIKYATLTIPLEKVGCGVKGVIGNIVVTSEATPIPEGDNIALNKSYTTYNLVDGVVTDADVISRGYSANLTDGEYDTNAPVSNQENPISGKLNCNDGKWFGFFANPAVPEEENCESGIGYVVIDLEEVQPISKIKMHVEAANVPASVKAYVSDTADGVYTAVGTLSGTAAGTSYWLSASIDNVSARYVKLEVGIASYWALFNEIEVYAGTAGSEPEDPEYETVEHSAVGKTATDLVNNTPLESMNGVFKFGAVLTDGIAQNKVNAADKTWYTFQKWYNCTNNVGSVVVDLGEVKSLDKISLHLANSTETFTAIDGSGKTATIDAYAPTRVEAFVSDDNVTYTSVGTFEIKSDENIVYWSDLDVDVDAQYVKIEVAVNTAGSYALLDEIAVYETEAVVEPAFIRGDVDDSGEVKTADYIILKRILLGAKQMDTLKTPETAYDRCDVNANGEVKTNDYLLLKRALLGTYKIPE